MSRRSHRSASRSAIPSVSLPGELWQYVERILTRFEEAWRGGTRPSIDDYLKEIDGERLGLLVELIHTDLACRLEAGEAARVEGYLERYPQLRSDPTVLLDLLAAEYLLRRGRGEAVAFEEYRERFGEQAADLPRLVALRQAGGGGEGPPVAWPAAAEAPTVPPPGVPSGAATAIDPKPPRFRLLRPHAHGGLGEVFVAYDEELDREVAVKEIQERYADDPESRARFLREAKITGALEHPGIVPVYGLGSYVNGRLFYAMRFIEGQSLEDALRHFHTTDWSNKKGSREVALAGLLRRFVDVCNAVAYAHSRGVLHRDLKPANVLLGPYGETLLVDWGLAKPLQPIEGQATPDRFVRPGLLGGEATQAGAVVGTPAYMAPEQAAGHSAAVGRASDIYSLGATLYHLLAGCAPFGGGEMLDVLMRVVQGQYRPVREANPSVPAGLAAICGKAMALGPQDRYASAKELATAVERWLALGDDMDGVKSWSLRNIGARFVGRPWYRRHLLISGLTLLALAALAVAVTVFFFPKPRPGPESLMSLHIGEPRERVVKALGLQQADVRGNPWAAGRPPAALGHLLQAQDLQLSAEDINRLEFLTTDDRKVLAVFFDGKLRALVVQGKAGAKAGSGVAIDSDAGAPWRAYAQSASEPDQNMKGTIAALRYDDRGIGFELEHGIVTGITLYPPRER
jgi:serine/threonine protein kinase